MISGHWTNHRAQCGADHNHSSQRKLDSSSGDSNVVWPPQAAAHPVRYTQRDTQTRKQVVKITSKRPRPFFCFLFRSCFSFEARSHVAQVGFKLTEQLRKTLNFRLSCLLLPNAGIPGWCRLEPRTSCMLGRHSPSDPYPQTACILFHLLAE